MKATIQHTNEARCQLQNRSRITASSSRLMVRPGTRLVASATKKGSKPQKQGDKPLNWEPRILKPDAPAQAPPKQTGRGVDIAAGIAPPANNIMPFPKQMEPDYFTPQVVQDLLVNTNAYQEFKVLRLKDVNLDQDWLSFIAQPWLQNPWFRFNAHPAVQALFKGENPQALAKLKAMIAAADDAIDSSKVRWAANAMKDASTSPAIYTGMTNMATIFDNELLNGVDRSIDVLVNGPRLARAIDMLDRTAHLKNGDKPATLAMADAFTAFWNKERRAKYLQVFDTILTDDHFNRIGILAHELLRWANTERIAKIADVLDQHMTDDRLDHVLQLVLGATPLPPAAIASGPTLSWLDRMDAASPVRRAEVLLAGADRALTLDRIKRLQDVLSLVESQMTAQRVDRAFTVLDAILKPERLSAYMGTLHQAANTPGRMDNYMATLEALATTYSASGGKVLDGLGSLVGLDRAGSERRAASFGQLLDLIWEEAAAGRSNNAAVAEKLLAAADVLHRPNAAGTNKLLAVADALSTPSGRPLLLAMAGLAEEVGALDAPGRLGKGLDEASESRLRSVAGSANLGTTLLAFTPTPVLVNLALALGALAAELDSRAAVLRVADATLPGAKASSPGVLVDAVSLLWKLHVQMFRQLIPK
eukprot:CAMPEP_0202902498 /NCGR_PEP_ID=MMETSP1392-20130828/16889_1 /ASSEMBLY_ACC=CAM_ASM_000868 /TAXON_ID=225041 /ORGANISM="Chlamydomonas chlamydogama, Strain SAG 11-48b" /LENGTH=647 /DNA_ID=CAMNT_0049589271 /DNA_START=259 /DNA_END=2202 /DNA_ORIENTATION=+